MSEYDIHEGWVYIGVITTPRGKILFNAPDRESFENQIRNEVASQKNSYPNYDFEGKIERFYGYPIDQVPQPGIEPG